MKKYLLIAFLPLLLAACTQEDVLDPDSTLLGMGGDSWEQTKLDEWLYDNFTKPYNVEVKYRWDPYDLTISREFAPVQESKVQPIMEALKMTWIEPYSAVTDSITDSLFMRTYAPKCFVLAGTREYINSTGTSTNTGKAEGTNKITILGVNEWGRNGNTEKLRILKTVQHEFAHVLHHTEMYPEAWLDITPNGYLGSGNWGTSVLQNAFDNGFISKYARATPNEDFVETVGIIIINGREWFDDLVTNRATSVDGVNGANCLRQKEAMVVNYFKTVWKIDFYESLPGAKDGLVYRAQKAIRDDLGIINEYVENE